MRRLFLITICLCGLLSSVTRAADDAPWLGVHMLVHSKAHLQQVQKQLPALAQRGVTHVIVEVGHSFDYQSDPKLGVPGGIDTEAAGAFTQTARQHGIEVIPEYNCLGHQSWKDKNGALLRAYPEFDETPGAYPNNEGIYCRSWCPQHPGVYEVVLPQIDELIDAFDAKLFHVGMDEVFLIASEHCPRCAGGDPAKLYARAVSDLHDHIVGERGVRMLMWADRLIDAEATGYSEWEASANGTAPAVDLIPKDIILCDWHYGKRDSYPSIPIFLDKGFAVWPAGWKDVEAAEALAADAMRHDGPKLLGYLCTTWGAVKVEQMADWPALIEPFELMRASPVRRGE